MTHSNPETLFEDGIIQIQLEREVSLLRLTFLKHPAPEQFRNGYRLAIDAAQLSGVRYWLTDAQQIKAMVPENQRWLVEQMAPLLGSAQLRRFAIVMAPECFVMTSLNQVYEKPAQETKAQTGGSIKVHFDKEAALDWVLRD